jgi:hypothetical protein
VCGAKKHFGIFFVSVFVFAAVNRMVEGANQQSKAATGFVASQSLSLLAAASALPQKYGPRGWVRRWAWPTRKTHLGG